MYISASDNILSKVSPVGHLNALPTLVLRVLINFLGRIGTSFKRDLQEIFLTVNGSIQLVEGYDSATAKRELEELRKAIKVIRKLDSRLQKVHFVHDPELEETVQLCLNAMNELEIELKLKAFAGSKNYPQKNSERYIIEGLSAASIKNIGEILPST